MITGELSGLLLARSLHAALCEGIVLGLIALGLGFIPSSVPITFAPPTW